MWLLFFWYCFSLKLFFETQTNDPQMQFSTFSKFRTFLKLYFVFLLPPILCTNCFVKSVPSERNRCFLPCFSSSFSFHFFIFSFSSPGRCMWWFFIPKLEGYIFFWGSAPFMQQCHPRTAPHAPSKPHRPEVVSPHPMRHSPRRRRFPGHRMVRSPATGGQTPPSVAGATLAGDAALSAGPEAPGPRQARAGPHPPRRDGAARPTAPAAVPAADASAGPRASRGVVGGGLM